MRAEATSSRLLAPSVRVNGSSASSASTTASAASKRGSGGSLAPPPLPTYGYGLRRPSAATSSVTSSTASSSTRRRASEEKSKASASTTAASPPKLALHELQSVQQTTPTTSFLRRGSGRTIATLGNAAIATPPTSQTSVQRKSGSPARQTSTTPTRQRSRGSSLKPVNEPRKSPQYETKIETQAQQSTEMQQFNSPEPFLRQRKRSADMMELKAQLGIYRQEDDTVEGWTSALTNGSAHVKREEEEVDEPPLLMLDDEQKDRALPTTPPRRGSAGTEFYGERLPVSPPDSKRLKRLTRSPKTPLGISSYTPSDGDGLSATQRVRLSLSGYMTVASLTGRASTDRRSLGGSGVGGLLTYSAIASAAPAAPVPAPAPTQSLFPLGTDSAATAPQQAPRSLPGSLNQSTLSQKRSKFAASRSQSGPAQVATALLPTKHSVDCLMGYIRELQLSEATLRQQVEKTRRQKHEELSRSMVRVNSLEMTMSQIEMERERERKELEEHQHMIQALTAEVTQLREYFAQQAQYEQHQQQQQQYPMNEATREAYEGDAYCQDQSPAADTNANEAYAGQWTDNYAPPVDGQNSTEQYHNGGEGNDYQQSPGWESGNVESEDAAQYSEEPVPGSSDETNVAPGVGQYSNAQAAETNYDYQADSASYATQEYVEATPEWAGQNAEYYGAEYQQYLEGEVVDPAGSEWNGQQQSTDDQSYDPQSQYQSEFAEAYTAQEYQQQGDGYNDRASYDSQPSYAPHSQPPLSPAASPEAVWNARSTVAASAPMIDNPPPMFRIAPRLSDIISPLARSSAAGANAAVDHNVLKPVTPQALENVPEEGRYKQQRGKNTVPVMTPPHPASSGGPPVFSMGDISSTFEPVPRLPTPPPSSLGSTGYQTPEPPSHQAHFEDQPVSEGPVNIEDEQFVPATQFFKPFQKLKLTNHKPPATAPSASPTSTKVPMNKLLIELFTTVDKQKLRMVEGYTTRYKGREEKLFTELTKKYGAEKVALLKYKFEHGEAPPQQAEEAPVVQTETAMTPPAPPPSRARANVLSPQSLRVDAMSSRSPDMRAPLSPEAGGSGIFGSESSSQPFLMSAASFDGSATDSPSGSYRTEQSTVSASLFSPPPNNTSPSRKVSPNGGRRRGPPLPFSFDEATAESTEEMLPVIPPPPVVSVNAPPLPPRSPAVTAPSSPPRLAPSPPRDPPPRSRSPVRNVGIVRQRVSPQNRRQSSEPRTGIFPPPLSAGSTPPKSGPPSGKTSPVQPVTLESLLNDLYRKHQPDKIKNVPAVVKEYTGKERELVAQLKQKYGALSVKKLELNLETLVQQGVGASASPPLVSAAPAAAGLTQPVATPVKKRGWLRRIVGLLIKLVIIRFIVVLLTFGGVATLNHVQCGKITHETSSSDTPSDCSSLQEGVDTFDYTRVTEYVQRVESRQCFCEKWTTQELALWQSPSVASSADLAKLTLFSRTIAEPAFFYFVDTYLPDLPWGEYYESYGQPTIHKTKEYYVVYLKPAIHSTKDYYEVYAKPVIQTSTEYAGVGYEQMKIVLKDVKARLAELPWDEYYTMYAQPTIQVGREYAALGYGHAKAVYAEVSVVVAESWAQLVEMYNEEGTQVVTRHERPANDESTGDASPSMDVLTKAAKASKSLAESSEIETVEDVQPSNDTPAEVVVPAPVEEVEPETVADVEPTVEVIVEQSGLSLEYAGVPPVEAESPLATEEQEMVFIVETNDVAAPVEAVASKVAVEIADESVSEAANVAADANVEEDVDADASVVVVEDVYESPVESVVETNAVESSEVFDVIEVVTDTSVEQASDEDTSVVEEQIEVSEEVYESAAESESMETTEDVKSHEVPEAVAPTHSVEEAIDAIVSEPMPEETDELPADTTEDMATANIETVSSPSQSEDEPVAEPVVIADQVIQTDVIEVVEAGIEVADEVPQPAVEEKHNEVAETEAVADEDVGDRVPTAKDQVNSSEPGSSSDEAELDTSADASLATPQETEASPEELAVLEDLDGLDPLELLDMAELAAAELYTVQ